MSLAPTAEPEEQRVGRARRVVYLLGAGATQGAVQFAGSSDSLVMPGLARPLIDRMREAYVEHFPDHKGMAHLVNDVIDDQTDFEHLLTFLSDTPSRPYQELADRLSTVFSTVLRSALDQVVRNVGERRSELFAALLDMHEVADTDESLEGFLTLNYDSFLEHAITSKLGRGVDYGVEVRGVDRGSDPIRVLKLHGSFGWRHTWPIDASQGVDPGFWIAPGIRKAKSGYPFNAIWGAARELLDCDVLRLIGCELGPNDWDLISLLFSTMHGRETAAPYEIEVIGWPETAARIAEDFPYFSVRSLLEVDGIGRQTIAELLGSTPNAEFAALNDVERETAVTNARTMIGNPFEHWLRLKGELMFQDLPTIETEAGLFNEFVGLST